MNSAKRLQPKRKCEFCQNRGSISAHRGEERTKVCKQHVTEVVMNGWTVFGWY